MSILDLLSNFNPFENFKEMEEIVLSYPKLKDRIKDKEEEKARALKIIKEIRAELSIPYLKTFEKFLDTTLTQLYDGINFHENNVDVLQLLKKNNIVLVPNHQSHADYVAINYVFYKKFQTPLYVAGGNNLNIFPIGPLFRKSGCFFIRRTFASDILYKLTLEAYLFYMLKKGHPIEFFFEGGRSRTGKLLPPRYGLYQMLIEANFAIPKNEQKELLFVPVSIAHEYVPEQKALSKELDGAKKKKENAAQVFGLIKLLSYQFGNVHINLGRPIVLDKTIDDIKIQTQKLAFDCFVEVGRNMRVTPTSLLAIILLDEPSGALKWEEILRKARLIVDFCQHFKIPITESLQSEKFEKSLERSMDIMIGNKKIDAIGNSTGKQVFYSIKEESRKEILYFKNTVLHHFLGPWIVYRGWMSLFNGQIETVEDLKKFFIGQRKQLLYEFYLPTVKEFLNKALDICSAAIGREVKTLEECMTLSHKELYQIMTKVAPFSRSCHYLLEAYYISGMTLKRLSTEYKEGFKLDTYTKMSKEVFDTERRLNRIIRYPESYSVPLSKSSLEYYVHTKMVAFSSGYYQVTSVEKISDLTIKLELDLEGHHDRHLLTM